MLPFFRRKRRDTLRPRKDAPFPWQQLLVLALCRLCEPIAFMSIFPYIYFMVKSFGITNDESQIAIYAGMVTSAFTFGEFSTGVLWGRISDRIGRKYVLLMGMFGTGLSMLLFGFSRSLPMALFARALGGLLNGNIGVLQTAVAEVVTVKAHQARAYSIMPFIWCIGSIIGSGLGGTLADPVRSYPSVFKPGSIWDKFPYLLPNLFCLFFVVLGLVIGFLFLQETHEEKKHRKDFGVQVGQWILRRVGLDARSSDITDKDGILDETVPFLADEENIPGYSSCSDVDSEGRTIISARSRRPATIKPFRPSVQRTFSKQVVLNIVGYGILALHTISFEQLLLILLASPLPQAAPKLPFKFQGGFALTSKEIGYVLSVQGFLQMLVQLIVFPIVNRKLGSLITFRIVILAYPVLYIFMPYLALLPASLRMPCVYLVVVWKVTAQSLSYPSAAIMLANLAPSKKVLGTLNGVAASSATLCRTIGPLFSGAIQSAGATMGYSGLSWWACALVAAAGAAECMFMKEDRAKEGPEERRNAQDEFGGMQLPVESESEATIYDEGRLSESDDGTLCDSPFSRATLDDSIMGKDAEGPDDDVLDLNDRRT